MHTDLRGRNEPGRADRRGIEQQSRKERRAVSGRRAARDIIKDFERRRFRDGWIRRQVEEPPLIVSSC